MSVRRLRDNIQSAVTKGTVVAEVKHTGWARELSTKAGEVTFKTMTFGSYLAALNIFDPKSHTVNFESDKVALSIQRAALAIQSNPIKQEMALSLCKGGLLPAFALQEEADGTLRILDGLQRSHVVATVMDCLVKHEAGDEDSIPDYARKILDKVRSQLITAEEFTKRPIYLQIYKNLTTAESVRLFIVLNLAQQKLSLRHLLESLHHQCESLFTSWGIQTTTERTEKARVPGARGRPAGAKGKKAEAPVYKLEFLVNSVQAYTTFNHQTRTKQTVTEAYHSSSADDMIELGPNLISNLMKVGDAVSRSDFRFLFRDLALEIQRIYEANHKWRHALSTSDNFAYPIAASLGKVRHAARTQTDRDAQAGVDRQAQGLGLGRPAEAVGAGRRVAGFHSEWGQGQRGGEVLQKFGFRCDARVLEEWAGVRCDYP